MAKQNKPKALYAIGVQYIDRKERALRTQGKPAPPFKAEAYVRYERIDTYLGESYSELAMAAVAAQSLTEEQLRAAISVREGFDGYAELQKVASAYAQAYAEYIFQVVPAPQVLDAGSPVSDK